MKHITPIAVAVLLLAGCAVRQPPVMRGVNGPQSGFDNMSFDQANAQCRHEATQWANTGYGDPFYKMMAGGQQMYLSCMDAKGFKPGAPQ